jgi:hypothetical protein
MIPILLSHERRKTYRVMFVLIVIFQYRIIHRKAFQHILLTDYSDKEKTASCMQVKGKAIPMLDQLTITPLRRMESGCIDSRFLDLGTDCRGVVSARPGRFTPREITIGTHWIGGWVAPRAGLEDAENKTFLTLPKFQLRPRGYPARSQSLYRLRYPGSSHIGTSFNIFSKVEFVIL